MQFLDRIIEELEDIAEWFRDAYYEVKDWIFPFYLLKYPFYAIFGGFHWLARWFEDFNEWVEDVTDKIGSTLSWDAIWSYFVFWFEAAENAWYWVRYAVSNVTDIISDWWAGILPIIVDRIADVESWTISQLNTFRDTVLALISDVKYWTTNQLSAFQSTILVLISDIKSWTTTQINTVQATFLALISDIKSWTTAQINTFRNTILATISDIRAWTTTEINTIKDTLSTLLPWGEILANIIAWGGLTGKQIDSVINTTLKSWFPFYDDLAELWEDIKLFFTDPLQWLYDRLDEFFERFW